MSIQSLNVWEATTGATWQHSCHALIKDLISDFGSFTKNVDFNIIYLGFYKKIAILSLNLICKNTRK